ncbi:MAG: hypothetical protein Q3966_09545, partial [Neisseria sp.]|nr:hypothetical protein [Neisseria sp.]
MAKKPAKEDRPEKPPKTGIIVYYLCLQACIAIPVLADSGFALSLKANILNFRYTTTHYGLFK